MRFVDYASNPGRSFSANPFFWNWRPLSRFVVSKIYINMMILDYTVALVNELFLVLQVTFMGNTMTY